MHIEAIQIRKSGTAVSAIFESALKFGKQPHTRTKTEIGR
jgi:hypothetical protein